MKNVSCLKEFTLALSKWMGEGQASGTGSGIEQSPHKEVATPVDWMGQQWEAHM